MANLVTFAKKLWKDATSGGTPITAAELNRMEGGINDCATQINRLGDSVSQQLSVFSNETEKKISLNDLTKTGLYTAFNPDNAPSEIKGAWITVINVIIANNVKYRSQILWSNNASYGIYLRNYTNGSWDDWVKS